MIVIVLCQVLDEKPDTLFLIRTITVGAGVLSGTMSICRFAGGRRHGTMLF